MLPGAELEEDGVRVSLTIIDTPGFGDQIDNEFTSVDVRSSCQGALTDRWVPSCSFSEIVGYLERQYDDILAEESRIKRNPRFKDSRVHALLYFITPTGHSCVVTPGAVCWERELTLESMAVSANSTLSSCAVSRPALTSSPSSARQIP